MNQVTEFRGTTKDEFILVFTPKDVSGVKEFLHIKKSPAGKQEGLTITPLV
ncbi:hypothetical protein M2144_002966 [Lachnospiraceae bacterium PFB1-22]|uniref:Uncharacterized protein n=1 Tax=Aequitasia blattaphilus TaxID=2949332 RepID=A0ABT1ED49_9FIRM|nr:hypothetical protein [Aequitasia blattaphilus]MCP1103752.1 hypothetical protein [Aequitasia blattaphilus]MCR8616392.1 hypothetical protein [Aequitasia blattaphilus]